jgi:CHAD domain-containing protein
MADGSRLIFCYQLSAMSHELIARIRALRYTLGIFEKRESQDYQNLLQMVGNLK